MREFLKSLNLDAPTINRIMAEYGKSVTKFKTRLNDYKSKVNDYETTIKDLNSKVATSSKDLENLQKYKDENKDLSAQLQMSGQNVKKEFSNFVKSEVLSMVDDNTDFGTALKGYKKDHPQYFGETQVIKTSSSPSLAKDNQPQTTSNIMNDIIRNSI